MNRGEKQNLSPYSYREGCWLLFGIKGLGGAGFSNKIIPWENEVDESGLLIILAFDLVNNFIQLLQKLATVAFAKGGGATANFAHVAQILFERAHW